LSNSDDVGASWSKPVDISGTIRPAGTTGAGTGHAGGIQLSSGPSKGRLIIPCYASHGPYVVYSDDHGQTWQVGGQLKNSTTGAGEWAVAETGSYEQDGTPVLLASRRNVPPHNLPSGITGKGYRLQALSHDGGLSWGDMWESKQLVEPIRGCEGGLLWHPGTQKLYFSHPDPKLDLFRTQLRIWSSGNMGATWEHHAIVWPGAAGYSSLVIMGDVSDANGSATNAELGVYYDRNNHTMAIFEAQSVSFTTIAA